MILNANSRAYGGELARHLLNVDDNEHATIHELRGFVANDLAGAFREVEAISQGTQCRQYLFSLSLNPPKSANVSVEEFEAAIAQIEERLGLNNQPRAVVFHEKLGRRHAHCVWSRINVNDMRGINLPHFKRKLTDISRELFQTYGWEMPRGLQDWQGRDPLNYSHSEAAQAKRTKRDPAKLKAMFQSCLAAADSRNAFAAALQEQGFMLACGDRRGLVAVDADGKVYSLSRWCGVKAKELRQRFGNGENLPSVDAATELASSFSRPQSTIDAKAEFRRKTAVAELVSRQRLERERLKALHQERRASELREFNQSLPKGMRAAWAKLTGAWQDKVDKLARDAFACEQRDRAEIQEMIERHLAERQGLEREFERADLADQLHRDLLQPDSAQDGKTYALDPKQPLQTPKDKNALTAESLRQNPSLIIDDIARFKASFSRSDVLRGLAKHFDDPLELRTISDTALKSDSLVRLDGGYDPTFTTRDYQQTEDDLLASVEEMSSLGGFKVKGQYIDKAIANLNSKLKRQYGSVLTDEQITAIQHIVSPHQLNAVVGWAGTGKSTLLEVSKSSWEAQGYAVHGLALAGKAADSLQSASAIQSRTLASLEASWESGYEPIEAGSVVVIDEAGMVGTAQLKRVTEGLQQRGCKLVLIGDPDQLQPIEAGTPFRSIVERIGTAKLTEIRRQSSCWQRRVSADLALGKTDIALQTYRDQGSVLDTKNRDHAIAKLVDDYVADEASNADGASRLALAHRRKDVHAINQCVRWVRKEVDPEFARREILVKTDYGPRAFAVGDRLLFSRNDRDLGVRNGMLATVVACDTDSLTVQFDKQDGKRKPDLTFRPSEFPSIDHGYAVTVHRAQGCTVDKAFVLSSKTMDAHLAYVAMTRHREEMRYYTAPDIERKRRRTVRQRQTSQRGLWRTR